MEMKKSLAVFTLGIFLGLLVSVYFPAVGSLYHPRHAGDHDHMADTGETDISREREIFLTAKDKIVQKLIAQGDYACCLEKPCTYCIEKTPGHGEGATCNCLADVMKGQHPCGECIGEILEGHGNRFLAPYFSAALAEELGESHLDELKVIISEKYGIAVEDQVSPSGEET